jgi:hypothetical protein
MLRSSKRSEWLLAGPLLAVACAAPATGVTSRAEPVASAARRAPGVVVEQNAEPPTPVERGNASDQFVVLRAPISEAGARETVRAFFRAVLKETPEALDALLAAQAFSGAGGNRQSARILWRARLNQLDYTELSSALVYHDSELELYRPEELAHLPARRRLPFNLAEDEIAIRVPVAQSSTRSTRLFGDELVFRLHALAGRFEIAEIWEDFRLP